MRNKMKTGSRSAGRESSPEFYSNGFDSHLLRNMLDTVVVQLILVMAGMAQWVVSLRS